MSRLSFDGPKASFRDWRANGLWGHVVPRPGGMGGGSGGSSAVRRGEHRNPRNPLAHPRPRGPHEDQRSCLGLGFRITETTTRPLRNPPPDPLDLFLHVNPPARAFGNGQFHSAIERSPPGVGGGCPFSRPSPPLNGDSNGAVGPESPLSAPLNRRRGLPCVPILNKWLFVGPSSTKVMVLECTVFPPHPPI